MQADEEEQKSSLTLNILSTQNDRNSLDNISSIKNDSFLNNSNARQTLIFDSELEHPENSSLLHQVNNPLQLDIANQNTDHKDFCKSIDKEIQKTIDFKNSIVYLSNRDKNKIYKNFLNLLLKDKDYLNSYQSLKQQVKNIPNSNHLTDLDKALRLEIVRLEGLKKRSIAEVENTNQIGIINNSVLDIKTNKSRFFLRGMDTLISDSSKHMYYDFIDGKHQIRKGTVKSLKTLRMEEGKRSNNLKTEDPYDLPLTYKDILEKPSLKNDFFLTDPNDNTSELRFKPYQYVTDNFNEPITRLEVLLNNLDYSKHSIVIDQIELNKSQVEYLDEKLKDLSFVKKIKNYFDKKAIKNPKEKMQNILKDVSIGKKVIDPYLAIQMIQSDIDLFNGKLPSPRKLEQSLSQMVYEIKNVKNLLDLDRQLDAIMIQVRILTKFLIFNQKKILKSQKQNFKRENPKDLEKNELQIINILNSISTKAYLFINEPKKFNDKNSTEEFKYLNYTLFNNVQSLELYCYDCTKHFSLNENDGNDGNDKINEYDKIKINTNEISDINRNMSNNKRLYVDYIANKYKLPWDKINNENNNK